MKNKYVMAVICMFLIISSSFSAYALDPFGRFRELEEKRDLGEIVALYITSQKDKDAFKKPMPLTDIARYFDVDISMITRDLRDAVFFGLISPGEKKAETKYRHTYRNIQNNKNRFK